MKNTKSALVSIAASAVAILASIFTPTPSHARWDVERIPTQSAELPETRLLENQPSRVLGYSVLRRTVPTSYGDMPVATIANSVIKKDSKTDVSILKMAEGVREAMKSPAWTREVQDGVTHFTASWPKEHRFLRLAIREEKNRWLISFSSVRAPYIKIGAEESDLLQRAFFLAETGRAGRKRKSASRAAWELLFSEAKAVSTSQVLDLLRGFQQSVRDVTDNVGINSARELSSAASKLSADAKGISQDLQSSLSDTSSTIKKTISFKNGFMFGVGIGVGTAVGTAATNWVLDGSARLFRDAWYAALGRMKPEDRDRIEARSSKALEEFVSASSKLEELENELVIYGMAATEAIGRPGVAIAELSEAQAFEYRAQMEGLKKRLAEAKTIDESRVCSQELSRLDSILRYKEAMRPVFMQNPTLPKICERIEALLENWKLAEAQLHQSKMVVASEMGTLLDGTRDRAIKSLPEDISERKRVNECESRIDDLVSRHQDLFKLSNCDGSDSKFPVDAVSCKQYGDKISSLNASKPECRSDAAAARASISPKSLNRSLELHSEETAILRKRFSAIAKADCTEGEAGSPCDGHMGDLEKLRERYRKRVEAARQACPSMTLVASHGGGGETVATASGGALTDGSGTSIAQGEASEGPFRQSRAPASAAADSGQTPESNGIFTRIWGSIRRFFGFQ